MLGSVGQSVTDFCENLPPPLPTWMKFVTGFGDISHPLWEKQQKNPPPTSGNSVFRKSVADFGEIRYRLWGNP
jgi:hypothetical protein